MGNAVIHKDMSVISSNSLFHFTYSKENLISILENDFYPNYCLERVFLNSEEPFIDFAIPMISFCDLSLSQIKKHINIYGNYGIGLKKEWGIANKINPVLYISPDSILADSLYNMSALVKMISEEDSEITESYLNLVRYLKPYEGNFRKNNDLYKKFRFYDEKEWRFVPPSSNHEFDYILPRDEFKYKQIRDLRNQILRKIRLKFQPKDIKYLIVKDESEISWIIQELKRIKNKYPIATIEILTSRIITSEQIADDF